LHPAEFVGFLGRKNP